MSNPGPIHSQCEQFLHDIGPGARHCQCNYTITLMWVMLLMLHHLICTTLWMDPNNTVCASESTGDIALDAMSPDCYNHVWFARELAPHFAEDICAGIWRLWNHYCPYDTSGPKGSYNIRAKSIFFINLCSCCCRCSRNTQIGNNATGWKRRRFRCNINDLKGQMVAIASRTYVQPWT